MVRKDNDAVKEEGLNELEKLGAPRENRKDKAD